jgi:hypothetical protein
MKAILGGILGRIPIPSPAMVVALVALLIAASGAAVAAIPSSDGTINACRDTRTGTLRVINAEGGQRCTTKETQLAWKDGITGKVADSEKLDGRDSTDFAKAYKRTVVVSPVGTDTDNGQALLDALSGITDASATKPYLLYIEPGTYDLGTGWLQMKEHVDIQGAGELQTLITRSTPSTDCTSAGSSSTVSGANNAELRFLTVQNMDGSNTGCPLAIFNDSASPHLTHVTAEASGSGTLAIGVLNSGTSSPTMTDVTVTTPGEAELGRSFGVINDATSSPTIRQSKLTGELALWVRNAGSTPGVIKVALTQLEGEVLNTSSGTLRCFNNYDHNLAPVTCP